jgi:hypothetical protein
MEQQRPADFLGIRRNFLNIRDLFHRGGAHDI